MPTVAIPGGTSPSLGRAITSSILSAPTAALWEVLILSRSSRIPLWLRAIDPDGKRAEVRATDYLDVESLASALKGVHTVISVTSAIDGTQAQIQINLVDAAVRAGCKRFAPSQWSFGPIGWEKIGPCKMAFEGVWEACTKHKDAIECARFNNGGFMNYLGHGIYPVPTDLDKETQLQKLKEGGGYMAGEDDACQGLSREGDMADGSGAFLIGMKNGIAELPIKDNGEWPRASMTTLKDVGHFVRASLDLPKWEANMNMVGDIITMGELLSYAEDITGEKFKVTTTKREEVEKTLANISLPDDFLAWMWADIKLAYIRDLDDEVGLLDPALNRLCPEVKPITTRGYLERYWKGN